MPRIWDPGCEQQLIERLSPLTADTHPQWGKFTAARMLAHCADAMKAGLGEKRLASKNTLLRIFPFNKLIIYLAPWPKGAPTAPELLRNDDPDFEVEKAECVRTLRRFAAAGPKYRFAEHAAFGSLSGNDWGALMYRHLDHHWRQFGL